MTSAVLPWPDVCTRFQLESLPPGLRPSVREMAVAMAEQERAEYNFRAEQRLKGIPVPYTRVAGSYVECVRRHQLLCTMLMDTRDPCVTMRAVKEIMEVWEWCDMCEGGPILPHLGQPNLAFPRAKAPPTPVAPGLKQWEGAAGAVLGFCKRANRRAVVQLPQSRCAGQPPDISKAGRLGKTQGSPVAFGLMPGLVRSVTVSKKKDCPQPPPIA